MIISRTPFRISFFGGGSDYPEWFTRFGGAVLSTSINKYCYLNVRYLPPFFEHRIRVVYSLIENVQRVAEIQHPVVRAVLEFLAVDRGIEIHHVGDLPARSGMGSSSSFTVGLLNAVHALQGKAAEPFSLARDAIHVERNLACETVGCQDQIAVAFGGFNSVRFFRDGSFSVTPVAIAPARLSLFHSHLLLFYTGISRLSSTVASSFVGSLPNQQRRVSSLVDMVDQGINILVRGRMEDFGHLLHRAWVEKSALSSAVSTPFIDCAYKRAGDAGATGGKVLGAGGGGFLLLFAPPDRHERIKMALSDLLHVPFAFEEQGSHILSASDEEDYSALDCPENHPLERIAI